MKSGFEETICEPFNAGEDVPKDSDECGTTCTGVEAKDGVTSAGKAIFKGTMESLVEECSPYVTPGEKVCEACDILSCAFYGGGGTAYDAKTPICEVGDEPLFGANSPACAHTA